jgi:hypothetical protein
MKNIIIYIVVIIISIILLSCSSVKKISKVIDDDTDLIGYMLNTRGLSRETARLEPETLGTLSSQQRLLQPHFLRYWKNPYEFPKFVYGILKNQEKHCADKEKGIFELFGLSQVRNDYKAAFMFDFVPSLQPDQDTPCAQGAGILGYGFLIDNAGDDTFTEVNNAELKHFFSTEKKVKNPLKFRVRGFV